MNQRNLLTKLIQKSIELINEINKDTASLTETRDKLQEEISQNKKVISSSIDKAIKEKDSIQDDIDSLNEIKKNIQSEINLLDSKKESLSEEYNNKVTLIKHGQEALKEREEALMAKEQNFEVIKARFQKKFEQEYPGRTVSV
jgi:DNA repair exonuclease SbcCD ATPase subunit